MVDRRPYLTVYGDGDYTLTSNGEDGSATMLTGGPDGTVFGSRVDPRGFREVMYLEPDGVWQAERRPDADTVLRNLMLELGDIWTIRGTASVRLAEGVYAQVTRGVDYDWNQWSRANTPAHRTPRGYTTGGHDFTTVWHKPEKTANGGTSRESFSYGEEEYHGRKSTYSHGQVTERDKDGHVTRSISRTGHHDKSTGAEEVGVTIRQGNGDWVKQRHVTQKDGTWTDSTTTKQGGHYVTRTATGHTEKHADGTTTSKTDSYRTSESETDPTDDGEGTPAEPPEKESPTGDGTEPGTEGNPEGPLSGVDIRDLIGDDWEGPEEVDDLGDLDRMMRPYLAQLRAALLNTPARPSTGEMVDDLGSPLLIEVDLSGYAEDPTRDHDPLGKPPPILRTWLGVESLTEGRESAVPVAELLTAAEAFAAAAKAVQVVRPS